MCGIAAVFAYGSGAPPVDPCELIAVRDHMLSRGPDGKGLWVSDTGRIGLAHRRLSIIDLSPAGRQPMWDSTAKACIVFNGEIYNFEQLRRGFLTKSCDLRSQTDTEVLLQLYLQEGVQAFSRLRGMYSFAIWDSMKHCLVLARDPFGIKPLYVADDGRTVRVASELGRTAQRPGGTSRSGRAESPPNRRRRT